MADQIGCLIIDLIGTELSADERELLAHPLVGGLILFTRNYQSREQLRALCREVRRASTTPLLIMVDQEGGRVQRFIPEFTRLPSMAVFGDTYDKNKSLALSEAKACGELLASELLTVGVDFSLAPVLDLKTGMSQVIGDRAFHHDPNVIAELATAFMHGMHAAGMAATGKHFPGHGTVQLDSHVAIPRDLRSFDDIAKADLQPFQELIHAGIDAMMAAHIIFPEVDQLPVGFSRFWLQDVLRQRLQFTGTIFSDDLTMEGANISNFYPDRVLAARQAGADFALLCNHRAGVIQVLDHLPIKAHQVNADKWRKLQGQFAKTNPIT